MDNPIEASAFSGSKGSGAAGFGGVGAVGALLALFFWLSHIYLCRVVRERQPKRDLYISRHALIMVHVPIVVIAPFLVGTKLLFILLACFWGTLLSNQKSVKGILRS